MEEEEVKPMFIIKMEEEEVKPVFIIKQEEEEPIESKKRKMDKESTIKKEEDAKSEIVIKQEDQEQTEFTEKQSERNTENREMPHRLKSHHSFTNCCVCGKMNQKYRMTLAPKQKKILVKWSQVFGSEFLETCSKDKANHYICAIHWKQLRDDWKGPLPEVLEKMKKENNGSFEVVMFLNDMDEEESNNQRDQEKFICRYCGARETTQNMTYVPTNEIHLLKWAQRLGQEFLENVKSHTKNKICWKHFKYRNEKNRCLNNLPMADEMMNEEGKSDEVERKSVNRYRCRYCGTRDITQNMTSVPTNEFFLMKWVHRLGHEFLENVKSHNKNQICWSHFKYREKKPKYYYNLPMTDEMMNETRKGDNIQNCRYCNDIREIGDMVEVPERSNMLARWVEILGPTFFDNVAMNSTNYICWSHFFLPINRKSDYLEYLPRVTVNHLEMQKNIKNSSIEIPIVLRKSKEQKQLRSFHDNHQIKHCCYCESPNRLELMKPVTKNPTLLSKWADYIGPGFLANVQNNISNYICLSHFSSSGEVGKIPIIIPME